MTDHYQHLEHRPHPWRRQLSLKGRRLTVGQLVGQMRANALSPADAAREYDLPIEAVVEALDYVERYREVIEADTIEEMRRITESLTDA